MQSHLLQIAATLKAFQCAVHRKQGDTPGALGRIGFCGKHQQITMLAVGNESFLTVNHILVTVFVSRSAHGLQI